MDDGSTLKPIQPELTLDEAVELACSTCGVSADRLDRAWLSTPLERSIAAAERARLGIELEPPDPTLPPEFDEYDNIVSANPQACMWDLSFGRIEFLAADEQAWGYEKQIRILGTNVVRSLPSLGIDQLDPDMEIAFHPPLAIGKALDLAAAAIGMSRISAHYVWYESTKLALGRRREDGTDSALPTLAHWKIEFDIWQAECRGGMWSNPYASAQVFEDGRVEVRRCDWMRRFPPPGSRIVWIESPE